MSAWHPACPTGCFLDQMLHSNVWRRLRQKLTALPCPCCVCLHRAMFFYVFLSQSHSSNSTRAANDVPWYIMYHHISPYYIMIFPNSSDARSWQLISFLNFQDGRGNKLPMWGLLGGLSEEGKKLSEMRHDHVPLECRSWIFTLFILFTMDFTISFWMPEGWFRGGDPEKKYFFH